MMAAPIPLPAAASEKTPAPKAKATQTSLRQTIAREAARTPLRSSAGSSRADQSNTGSTGFFKSKPGAIALAVMVVGSGYALYSASHDKIHSPGRK